MIIIEGMDNTGKSTLSQNVAKDLGAVLINHRGMPLKNPTDYHRYISISGAAWGIPRVFDRHPLVSEPIYGPICRNFHIFTTSMLVDGWKFLCQSQDVVLVYCRPSSETIFNTLTDREQMEGVSDHRKEILDAYDSYFEELKKLSPLQVYVYDYTTDTYDCLLNNLRGKA